MGANLDRVRASEEEYVPSGATAAICAGSLRYLVTLVVCLLLAAASLACGSGDEALAGDERVLALEEGVRALEGSLEALAAENAELKAEVAAIRQDQADFVESQEAAEAAKEREEEVSDKEQWSKGKDEGDTALERTDRLAKESGGKVHYVDYAGRETSVLVTPLEFVDGETPLIVSLHGFGGDSSYQAAYVPLHQRVNTDGFGVLLPNGQLDPLGNRFWNPTDECCQGGKTGGDDVAFLTALVAEAKEVRDFGPVYFFGYSNGGFMSHHMACKGLPGLRAVASLAGTSYVEDTSCEGAPPVSVLHVHGTADSVILYEGDESESVPKGDGKSAFYAGAREMVTRWSRRAGCDWPEDPQPHATLDLDQYVAGSETQAFRVEAGCAEGTTIELWMGRGSSHSPGYGDAFLDALVDWLLSQD